MTSRPTNEIRFGPKRRGIRVMPGVEEDFASLRAWLARVRAGKVARRHKCAATLRGHRCRKWDRHAGPHETSGPVRWAP